MKVLDHGSVTLIEKWGSEEQIIEAARMSTGKGFLGWGPTDQHCCNCGISKGPHLIDGQPCQDHPHAGNRGHVWNAGKSGDEKLLRFLYENNHSTPFEMAGLVIEVQAPIFIFREWHRHRTQSYNEMSSRYTPLPDVHYIPTVERLMMNAGGSNKQAGTIAGSIELTEANAKIFQAELRDKYEDQQMLYNWALKSGIPKELARIHLPVGRYSRMRASANLRNWLAFLTLREAPNAQWEIQEFARAVSSLIKECFPRTHALYVERAVR